MSTPEEQLAEIRAKRAALAEERAAAAAGTIEEQIAAEARALAGEEAFTSAVKQFGAGRVAMVNTSEGPVVLRSPHVAAYRKFQDAEGVDTAQTIELVRKCLLYPTQAELTKLLEIQPGVLVELADSVVTLAGHRRRELRGK